MIGFPSIIWLMEVIDRVPFRVYFHSVHGPHGLLADEARTNGQIHRYATSKISRNILCIFFVDKNVMG